MKQPMNNGQICRCGWAARTSAILLIATAAYCSLSLPVRGAEMKRTITDSGITAAVQADLQFDKGVPAHLIGVTTSQGIVSLSGAVDNVLAKDRAVNIAETIRGVRGVINQIVVTPVSRPDEDIRKDILMALLQDPATESYQVKVSVDAAVVTLTGSVGSWAESQLAARVARGVSGVKEMHNDLVINYTAKRTDSEMAADVGARLQWDIWVAGDPISVKVKAGKVALTGAVGSALEKSRAADDAWVSGVAAVDDSDLKVDPELSKRVSRKGEAAIKSDEQIKQAVLASFRYDPRLAGVSPTVMVEEGGVILSGKVTHLKAKTAAEQDAMNTLGVTEVANFLAFDPFANLPGDADTEKALRAALAWDPLLADAQIKAAVIGHAAYLSGTVDSRFQTVEAQDVASRVKGVRLVRNHLKVEPEFSLYDYSYYDWPFYSYYDWPSPYGFTETYGPAPLKSDEQIKMAIEKSFFWSPFVHRNDIKVTVDGGVVVLTGTVGSWMGYWEAYQDARKSGVATVINKLKVEKGAWF
jgi:osmotically-inducible protein OsmY